VLEDYLASLATAGAALTYKCLQRTRHERASLLGCVGEPLKRAFGGSVRAKLISFAHLEEKALLYMIIEHFENQDPVPVYRRFRDQGRLAPEGLRYVSSWVDERLERCFQLMETEDRKHLDEWIVNWNDLVKFEVYPVISSKEAVERISPRL
jgi:hypothetical protein